MIKAIILAAVVLVSPFVFAATAKAQYRSSDNNESREDRSRFWNTDEGSDFDYEEVRKWREQNSQVREKIDDLDNDSVEDLPIPILLGVSLSDLYPSFGDPRDGGDREHEGLDIMATDGTPIISPTEAVVIRVGDGAGSGKYVSTANPGGETFVYMHLSAIADIDEGDRLQIGDLIGYVGNTGNASGGAAHLHFEIRENREPSDPIERLTREFTLREKIEFLDKIIPKADDEEELIEFLVTEYLSVFVQARLQGIEIPEAIEEALPVSARAVTATGAPTRDLQLGDQGVDIIALQSRLIAEGYLKTTTPTDQFGPLTQAALIAYQQAKDITPASGYYGPLTRQVMGGSVVSATTTPTMTRAQLIAEIERLLKLIEEKGS